MSRVSWFLRPLRPRGLNSQGALWQILKRGSKIAKKLRNFTFLIYFFMLNRNLTSIFGYFFNLPFKNPFFCNFWGKNVLFGYFEYAVVTWLSFSLEPHKNISQYIVQENLAVKRES